MYIIMTLPVNLRSITADDLPFLYSLYASTREELDTLDWDETQKQAFVTMQFNAQHHWYTTQYEGADFSVIEANGEPIGRLYVYRTREEIRLMDIALLPQWRNGGIGSRLLADLIAESERDSKPITLHVEPYKPAFGWYQRRGFETVEDTGMHLFMRRMVQGGIAHV